jgi:hypothetical protein
MPNSDRMIYINKVRSDIVNSMTVSGWKLLGQGELFRLQYTLALRPRIHGVDPDKVCEAISNGWKTTSLSDLLVLIKPIINVELSQLEQIETNTFSEFQTHVQTNWADEWMIEVASDHFKHNIIFIDATTRKVYKRCDHHKYDKYILVCWVENSHYESIGLITGTSDDGKYTIKRTFKS